MALLFLRYNDRDRYSMGVTLLRYTGSASYHPAKPFCTKFIDCIISLNMLITVICNDKTVVRSLSRYFTIQYFIFFTTIEQRGL